MKKYKVTIEREFEVEIDDEKLLKNSPNAFEAIKGRREFKELAEVESAYFDLCGHVIMQEYVTVEKLEECFRTEEI